MKIALRLGFIGFLLVTTAVCHGTEPYVRHGTQPPVKARPTPPEYLQEKPDDGFTLPPAPETPKTFPAGPAFELTDVVFEGNTVFSDETLKSVAAPFLGGKTTLADLEALRYQLTKLYIDHGYINSGALLKPGQSVDDGIVAFTIVEGKLKHGDLTGNGRLRPGYIRKRLWPEPRRTFNTDLLQQRFQLLLADPLIEKMDGRFRPGEKPGEAVLDLDVTRARPYSLSLTADNHSPPSTGAETLAVAGAIRNITGYGDTLNASVGLSEGATSVDAGYSVFLNARNTKLSLFYSYSENSVIEEPLDDIDIESDLQNAEITVTHPVYQSLSRSIHLGISLAVRESKTYLLDQPFSFSPGAEEGESRITVMRLVQSFLDRTHKQAIAIRSTVNFGVDLFGPTIHSGNLPDSQYVSWLGQVQYARRIGQKAGELILRGDVQIAEDHLLPLERFAVGGANTVRGYRENEMVRDNGYILSIEWRYPIWRGNAAKGPANLLQIAPFMDYGGAWNKGEDANDEYLHSVGVGLIWTPNERIHADFYIAHDIEAAVDKEEYDLQDDGIHFSLTANLF